LEAESSPTRSFLSLSACLSNALSAAFKSSLEVLEKPFNLHPSIFLEVMFGLCEFEG